MTLPAWLTGARRVTVLTGAGISTDSGIPDYRGPDGLWTRDPDAEKLVTLSYYVADQLNGRPRETLDFLKPAEVMAELLSGHRYEPGVASAPRNHLN